MCITYNYQLTTCGEGLGRGWVDVEPMWYPVRGG
jgi:hypothetical protein